MPVRETSALPSEPAATTTDSTEGSTVDEGVKVAVEAPPTPVDVDAPVTASADADFTNDDALRVVFDAQMNLVRGTPSSSWGRLWWLARIASEQARVFSNDAGASTTPSAVAGVNERD